MVTIDDIDIVIPKEKFAGSILKTASVEEFRKLVGPSRKSVVRGEKVLSYLLITSSARKKFKFLRLEADGRRCFEVTIHTMGASDSVLKRKDLDVERPPFTVHASSLENGEIIVTLRVSLDKTFRQTVKFIVNLGPIYPRVAMPSQQICKDPNALEIHLRKLVKHRHFLTERDIQLSLTVGIVDPIKIRTSIVEHTEGIYVICHIVNVQKDHELILRGLEFFCNRSTASNMTNHTFTSMNRFYSISCDDMKLPVTLKALEEQSYVVRVQPLPFSDVSELNSIDKKKRIKTKRAIVSMFATLSWNCGSSPTDSTTRMAIGEYPIADATYGAGMAGMLEDEDALSLELETKSRIHLLQEFSIVATISNSSGFPVEINLTHKPIEKKEIDGASLVCLQSQVMLHIPAGTSRSATISFLPLKSGFQEIGFVLEDKDGINYCMKDPIRVFVHS
mmetsp:Transcript_5260/g.7744  ORF Transcript_5260/g.7744 Transcript_5260/m.7744 type:complete len:448 (-) Transcript_5260:123-1466(-)